VTRAYVVDLASRTAATITAFESEPDQWGPPYRAAMSDDGKRLFVAQNSRQSGASADNVTWSTRLAMVNTADKKVERVVNVPGDTLAMISAVSSNGRTVYFVRDRVRNGDQTGYRFMAMDVNRAAVEFDEPFDLPAGDGTSCGIPRAGLTPDGRALWMLCLDSVQFFDPQSGRRLDKVSLGPGGLDHFNLTEHRVSPDHKLLYIEFTSTNELFVVDLTQRTVLRQAAFKDTTSSHLNPLEWLSQILVSTASAKLAPEPGLVLSKDGQRLYFVGTANFESGDGIWGVDTATLKPLGHWLRRKEIIGVQLSADGRELYAVDWKERKLYVLDALSGEIRRTFDQVASEPSGFVSTR
jgi:hypothetical protein